MTDIKGLYSDKVMDHFLHPRNMGEIKNPDGVATVGNPQCGDVMQMFLKIEKKDGKEYVKEAKFQTLGCGAAISTSSIATEMIKGKPLVEAEKLTNKAVMEALGGLPKAKIHCSVLAAEAVKKAIADYESKKVSQNEK